MRHFKELAGLMSEEQKKESQELYDKFYGEDFGNLEPVKCLSDAAEDLYHDRQIDMSDWD